MNAKDNESHKCEDCSLSFGFMGYFLVVVNVNNHTGEKRSDYTHAMQIYTIKGKKIVLRQKTSVSSSFNRAVSKYTLKSLF